VGISVTEVRQEKLNEKAAEEPDDMLEYESAEEEEALSILDFNRFFQS